MEIIVCGPGCAKCDAVENLINDIIVETGSDATVVKVKDFNEFAKFGVFSTPAVVIDGKVVCVGKIPSKQDVLSWLK